ncbi:hypothetical protein M569_11790, partial [Genlisea aurea]
TDPLELQAVYDIMRATGNEWAESIPDVCRSRWHGIECLPDDDGGGALHVVSLSFGALSDDTAFPTCGSMNPVISEAVTKLPRLRSLFFYRCLDGNPQEIPRFLGELGSGLRNLVLRGNGHVGGIPEELGNLTGLEVLDLHGNDLSGAVPASLGRIRGLRSLDLSWNRLSGSVPSVDFPVIRVLDLNGNRFAGALPIRMLSSGDALLKVDLSGNEFSGGIHGLSALKNLILLDLSYNELVGALPESLSGLASLQALILAGNPMAGAALPETAFVGLSSLLVLVLSDMSLEGPIPRSIGELKTLRVLRLDGNRLNGSIPESFSALSRLSELRLDSCRLTGPIPFTGEMISRMGRKLRLENNLGLCYGGGGIEDDLMIADGIPRCDTLNGRPDVEIERLS